VSEAKQKWLQKLGEIVKRRKPSRKWRRFKRTSSTTFSFTSNKYEALEEIREMLGFTDEELRLLFALWKKADGGYLTFKGRDITVEFNTNCDDEIVFIVRVEEKGIAHLAEYKFNHEVRNVATWKKRQ